MAVGGRVGSTMLFCNVIICSLYSSTQPQVHATGNQSTQTKKKNIKPFEAEMLTAKTTAFLPKSLEFANSPVSHHRR
jgi:hypothetical protein